LRLSPPDGVSMATADRRLPSSVPAADRRLSHCPECSTRGIPIKVNCNRHLVLILYACEQCGHHWIATSRPRPLDLKLFQIH